MPIEEYYVLLPILDQNWSAIISLLRAESLFCPGILPRGTYSHMSSFSATWDKLDLSPYSSDGSKRKGKDDKFSPYHKGSRQLSSRNKETKEDSMGSAQEKAPEGANEKKQSKEQNEEAILQS